jgi:hypothetical protein
MVKEKPLVYPPVVLAHIVTSIEDQFKPKVKGKDCVHLHYSAQLNGHPHMGTLTSLATAFAVGELMTRKFNIPAELKFEALDNAPIDKRIIDGKEYCLMHRHSIVNGLSKADLHWSSYEKILDYLKNQTGVSYTTEDYPTFQANPFVRSKLVEIINRKDEFLPFISPSERLLRVRFPCPKCQYMEKTSRDSKIIRKDESSVTYKTICPSHGSFQVEISPDNDALVDFNTSIRNVIKEARFIEEARNKNAVNLMIDGGDWIGMAMQIANSLDLFGYRISDLPLRVFTPIIEDWSGAKFSKSIYVNEGIYDGVPEEFVNFERFNKTFGERGLDITLQEARDWAGNPKKLFRNYSVEYLRKIYNI